MHERDRGSIPGMGQTLVFITGGDCSTAKRSRTGVVSRVLVDDQYKELAGVTVAVARKRTLAAQWPRARSKCVALHR